MDRELDAGPQEQATYTEPALARSWMTTAICALLVVSVLPIAVPGVIALVMGIAMMFGPFGFVVGVGGVLATGLTVWSVLTVYRISRGSDRLFAAGCCAAIEAALWMILLVNGWHLGAFTPRPLVICALLVAVAVLVLVPIAKRRHRKWVVAQSPAK